MVWYLSKHNSNFTLAVDTMLWQYNLLHKTLLCAVTSKLQQKLSRPNLRDYPILHLEGMRKKTIKNVTTASLQLGIYTWNFQPQNFQ
jgi:hypothetical protein